MAGAPTDRSSSAGWMAGVRETKGTQQAKRRKTMIALKMFLTVAGVLLLATALAIPLYSLWLRIRTARRKAAEETEVPEPDEIPWRGSVALTLVACLPLLVASSIVVVH